MKSDKEAFPKMSQAFSTCIGRAGEEEDEAGWGGRRVGRGAHRGGQHSNRDPQGLHHT